jgi:TRAP-type C4-dicarboxylate transport system permease small subunit
MPSLADGYRLLMQGCGLSAALAFGLVALLVTFDVAMRNLGFGTLPWVVEITEYALPFATFLAAPWLLYSGQHVRVDALVGALPRRAALAIEFAADLAGLAIALLFVYYGLAVIVDSWRINSLIIKTLVFPEWWLFAPLPLCGALLALEFARRLAAAVLPRPG